MKKLISMLLVLACLTTLLIPAALADGKVEITFYGQPGKTESNRQIIAAFEAQYPNIKVTHVELAAETDQRLATMSAILQAKDPSMDVFEVDCTWPLMFISAGWLADMSDVMSAEEKAEFFDGTIAAGSYEGRQYTLPLYIDMGCLFYRKDVLEKYGYEVPKTWDELIQTSVEIMQKDPDITAGFTSAWRQYEALTCCALEFIWAAGGDIIDADGNVVINSPETVAGIQMMYDMMNTYKITDPGVMSYNWGGTRGAFYSGHVLFTRDWQAVIDGANDPKQSNIVGLVGYCPLPVGAAGLNPNTTGGWHIGVSAYSAHPEEAKLFAKFQAGYEAQKIRAIVDNVFPTRPAVYEDADILQKIPYLSDLKEIGANTKGRPVTPYYQEVSSVLQQGIGGVLTNQFDAQTAVNQMETQLKEIMSR